MRRPPTSTLLPYPTLSRPQYIRQDLPDPTRISDHDPRQVRSNHMGQIDPLRPRRSREQLDRLLDHRREIERFKRQGVPTASVGDVSAHTAASAVMKRFAGGEMSSGKLLPRNDRGGMPDDPGGWPD